MMDGGMDGWMDWILMDQSLHWDEKLLSHSWFLPGQPDSQFIAAQIQELSPVVQWKEDLLEH